MRKHLIFILLLLEAINISDMYATPVLLGISWTWTAVNTAATCYLCCLRCQDKKKLNRDITTINNNCNKVATDHALIHSLAMARILDPDNSQHDRRPRPILDGVKSTVSQATNTDMSFMTPPIPKHHFLDKQPPSPPAECQ